MSEPRTCGLLPVQLANQGHPRLLATEMPTAAAAAVVTQKQKREDTERQVTPSNELMEILTMSNVPALKKMLSEHNVTPTSDKLADVRGQLVQLHLESTVADARDEFERSVTAAVNRRFLSLEERLDSQEKRFTEALTTQKQQLSDQLIEQQQQITDLKTELEQLKSSPHAASDTPAQPQKQWRDIVAKDVKIQITNEVVNLNAEQRAQEARKLELCVFNVEVAEGKDLVHVMQELVKNDLKTDVTVLTANRLQGKESSQSEGGSKPRPVIIRLQSVEDKITILKAAPKLKDMGSVIRFQINFTREQQQHRSACWPQFIAAKGEGKRCQWTDEKLFVDGKEHIPAIL